MKRAWWNERNLRPFSTKHTLQNTAMKPWD